MLSSVKPDDELIKRYEESFKNVKRDFLMHAEGLEKNVVLYMITANVFKFRPAAADPLFWPFQYVENKGDENRVYTPDYFTEKALNLIQKSTARELLGLSFKDVMEMDYGMYLFLENLLNELEDTRRKQMEELSKQNNDSGEGNK